MSYLIEFPDFDDVAHAEQMIDRAPDWEDVSWGAEPCPSFRCDVFVLWIEYIDPSKREFPDVKRFTLTDEFWVVLETDEWADVLAFMDDGKRDF